MELRDRYTGRNRLEFLLKKYLHEVANLTVEVFKQKFKKDVTQLKRNRRDYSKAVAEIFDGGFFDKDFFQK